MQHTPIQFDVAYQRHRTRDQHQADQVAKPLHFHGGRSVITEKEPVYPHTSSNNKHLQSGCHPAREETHLSVRSRAGDITMGKEKVRSRMSKIFTKRGKRPP